MTTSQMSGFIQHLRRAVLLPDGAGMTDGQLLEDYISRRDEAALAALVRRHGPMVWGVCRRVLRNYHDVEDAFQATFLVLVRRAASIASRKLVANWLYGVAHQTALKARATAAKKNMRERQVTEMPQPAVAEEDLWNDLQPLLDEELTRLPDKYRVVIVLCDLEGKTRKEAARQLGCPEGTVAGRLARARALLAKRLSQRGVAWSGGAVAAVLAQQAASAGVPYSVVDSTIKAASLLAAGKAAATGAISVKVAALTEGVMKGMLFTKLKTAIAVVLILGFVATGATILTCRTAAGQEDKKPTAEKPVEPAAKQEKEKKKEGFIAWGKVVGGLQAGLGISNTNDIRIGGKVQAVVKLRNVSKETIKVSAWPLWMSYPGVVDARGQPVRKTTPPHPLFSIILQSLTLKPDETVDVGKTDLLVAELDQQVIVPDGVVDMCTIHVEPGKHKADCIGFLKELPTLATGTVEFEVKPAKNASFTAWGKEAGGLQAGLGFRPGKKRAYSHGETVKLVVRVRNVGKEEVTFNYIPGYFVDWPPSVSDGEGKTGPQVRVPGKGGDHNPVQVNLAPGKEIELAEVKLELRPASESGNKKENTLYGTGKFQIHYERVMYSSGAVAIASILRNVATGKLDLEVKPDRPAEKK